MRARSLRLVPSLIALVVLAAAASAQSTLPLSFGIHPGAIIPLGADAKVFGAGGGADITADYALDPFFLRAGLGYGFDPVKSLTSISVVSLSLGGGWRFTPAGDISMALYGQGGYYFAFLNDRTVLATRPDEPGSGGNPLLSAGIAADWRILPNVSVGIDASYRAWLGLSQGIAASLGATWHMSPRKEAPVPATPVPVKPQPLEKKPTGPAGPDSVILSDVHLQPLFPVLYSYYDDHPIGKAILRNTGAAPITGIHVTLFARQLMDDPKPCEAPESLGPGENAEISLRALLGRQVLAVTESTKASARIQVTYTVGTEARSFEVFETLVVQDRNGLVWDDDRKAAAFVNTRDADVLALSRLANAAARASSSFRPLPVLLGAMATHETVRLHGVKYAVDPSSPYATLSKNKLTVDFLQFPRQTLEYKSGDCDDLSILYAAVLESQGIATAFITTPGHIFIAADLRLSRDDAVRQFSQPGDLIYRDGRSWLPVEVTALGGGFLEAWRIGAQEWRESDSRKEARFIPLAEAWAEYKPTAFEAGASRITLPLQASVQAAVTSESQRFIEREIGPRSVLLEKEFKKSGSPKSMNSLGVLYARYGINEKAEAAFRLALSRDGKNLPARVNLGELLLLTGRTRDALQAFRQAEVLNADNTLVMLGLAVANHALENYGEARTYYERLRLSAPTIAERYAFLDMQGQEAARAAEATQGTEVMQWQE